ncbi:Mediator of RNA polymerase II transcription subunit 25 [Citrus sinensis]|uniref:Mediator of RNA polymerase II transcription subunit 25 n=1 Tax=Citrus sinensis TaxID=2711 RepID=A0ACB8LF68_CITSI|nr:Mediator of RNA polymerase II transcription subunit 25 [Citrus sinensis]
MSEKQLIVAVEGTAAMGPYWQSIVSDYLEKIISGRSFIDCCNIAIKASRLAVYFEGNCFSTSLTRDRGDCNLNNERKVMCVMNDQKTSASNVELSLVTFNTHGSYCACLVQRSGWTKDVDIFLHWLSTIPFAGGGFNDAAIAEGLSEALMMFSVAPNGSQNQQNVDGQRHCILVAASNPHPLPTPVYRPQMQNLDQNENNEAQAESRLSDAETVAKSFVQCSVSLSVICPKQLPKLTAIYNAAKRNPRAADPPVDNSKNPHFLVLISENFMEARAALSRPGVANLALNQNPVKMDIAPVTSVTGPAPTSIPSVNGINRPPISVGNVPTATVKVEPSTVTSMVNGPTFPHIPSVPRPASQGVPSLQTSSPSSTSQEMITSGDSVPEVKPLVSGMSQPLRPMAPAAANVNILNNLSQARQVMNNAALTGGTSIGLQSMGQTPMAMHMSNMISSGMASSVPTSQPVFSSAQSGITSIGGSGTLTGTSQVPQNSGLNSFTSAPSNLSGNSNPSISQPMGTLQGGASMGQSVGMSQGNHSGGQMVQNGISMNQNMMSGLGPSGVSSGTGTMIPTPGMSQQAQSGMQPLSVNNNTAVNMQLSQQTSSALHSSQSKYVKVWEGSLSGQRQGQPVFITKLEGYRSASASETQLESPRYCLVVMSVLYFKKVLSIVKIPNDDLTAGRHIASFHVSSIASIDPNHALQNQNGTLLAVPLNIALAANWPPTMQIVRLISQDHMNNKQYVGKADFLVFRAMNQHGFLGQLQEKKLCAVIQLPSQTLLLSVSDKACRLIGMLFPGVRFCEHESDL